jgi:DNA-binding CsgD family transcriptional regulator
VEDLPQRLAKLQSLTPRQLEVLHLLEEGKSHAEIAEQLVITKGAVQFHVSNIYFKLGLADLPKGQRQRELGKFGLVLPHLPAPPLSTDRASSTEEPPPETLEALQAISAALEDDRSIVLWQPQPIQRLPPIVVEDSSPRPVRKDRLPTGITQLLLLFIGALVGGSTVAVFMSVTPRSNSARTPTVVSVSARLSAADTGQRPTSLPGDTVTAPTPPLVLPTSAVVNCGITPRITAPAIDRFLKSEGVSVFTRENTGGGVLNNRVRTLALDPRGLWIGYFATSENPTGGIGHYDKQTWANCQPEPSGRGVDINSLATDQRGQVWAATAKAGVMMFDGAHWRTYTTEDGLPSNETFGLAVDKDDNIWLATLA